MNIYINGRFLTQRITGVQRYAREIVGALDKLLLEKNSDVEWCILSPTNIIEDLPTKYIKRKKCGKLTGHLWEQIELPYYAKDGYLINLCNCAPLIKKNQLVAIHDAAIAAFPQAYSWKFRIWYRIMCSVCGQRADKIVTVSQFSCSELHKYFNIDKEKIKVVYNGIDHMDRIEADDSIIEELNLSKGGFVFAVSSKNPTKNFSLVLKAARLLPDVKFVIAGGSNNAVFASDNREFLNNVTYTGYVSDEKLISLYRHAAVFVYPSLYEGFGIPPLEAMSQGCPVIVSDCASLPEVCGKNAMYCKPQDGEILANKIVGVFSGEMVKIDIKNIKHKYSWDKSARCLKDYVQQ